MGFITKNYINNNLNFLMKYGFEKYGKDYSCEKIYNDITIFVSINNDGKEGSISIYQQWVNKFYMFKIQADPNEENNYIKELDDKVTAYLEDQGYDSICE